MIKDFLTFLKEYKVVSLAIAFVMGAASTDVVHSLVSDIFMPIVAPLLGGESWKTATANIGPIHLAYGSFIAALLNFIILALVVFLIAKKLFKEDKNKHL